VRALLISTYDLGRQPFGLASAAAALRAAGAEVACADLSRERLADTSLADADVVALFLPMHTATRLALPVIDRVRRLNPGTRIAAYGLYAPLNAALLREHGVSAIIGGEFEDELVDFVLGNVHRQGAGTGVHRGPQRGATTPPRVTFRIPDRSTLPPLTRYATLQIGNEQRTAGYTEASRGCKHRCRHCPVVAVYDGRFRIVPVEIVMADIRGQVAAGARHITFGDPDFLNGIRHATAILEAFWREFRGVSYDVTIKIEHLLAHADVLPLLRDTGCAFVTSAVESLDDRVLALLEKGHTRSDFERVVQRFRETGLTLAPTFVAFTPWTTLGSYCELLQTIDRLNLVEHVAPIQLAIRLLVTEGSRLLGLHDIQTVIGRFDAVSLTFPWRHADPRVDELQREMMSLVGVRLTAPRRELFDRVWRLAHERAGLIPAPREEDAALPRAVVPYLNEPWYC
jgi:radical SAM superfamily enzyme YgiQ (UPF0313 family)